MNLHRKSNASKEEHTLAFSEPILCLCTSCLPKYSHLWIVFIRRSFSPTFELLISYRSSSSFMDFDFSQHLTPFCFSHLQSTLLYASSSSWTTNETKMISTSSSFTSDHWWMPIVHNFVRESSPLSRRKLTSLASGRLRGHDWWKEEWHDSSKGCLRWTGNCAIHARAHLIQGTCPGSSKWTGGCLARRTYVRKADLLDEVGVCNRREIPKDSSYVPFFNVPHLRAGPLVDPWIVSSRMHDV